jgi:hypothetical protein
MSAASPLPRKFSLGVVNVSPAALEALFRTDTSLTLLLKWHVSGDLGEMCYDDKIVNEKSIKAGGRVLSSYPLADDTVLWVITQAGWQNTIVIVREEY